MRRCATPEPHREPAGEPHRELVEAVRAELGRNADPVRAAGQQAYMKSALPYRGLTAPRLTAVLRPLLADRGLRLPDRPTWEATIRTLWDEVTYREEWYAALAVARHRAYRGWVDGDAMPLWRHLVVTGAWWDVVDVVATDLVRTVLERSPDVEALRLREWATDGHLWVRRTAIISQVGRRDATDQALLADVIEPNLDDRDFFIRKAIGWALRDHARADPEWVRAYVTAHEHRLSGLSRREATKHLH